MTKRLSERIAMQMKAEARKASGHSRAVFLSLQDEIEEAVSDGWTLKAIWAILYREGKVKFKYGMFRRYAQQILSKPRATHDDKNLKEVIAKNNSNIPRRTGEIRKGTPKEKPKIKTFEINSDPNIEDFM